MGLAIDTWFTAPVLLELEEPRAFTRARRQPLRALKRVPRRKLIWSAAVVLAGVVLWVEAGVSHGRSPWLVIAVLLPVLASILTVEVVFDWLGRRCIRFLDRGVEIASYPMGGGASELLRWPYSDITFSFEVAEEHGVGYDVLVVQHVGGEARSVALKDDITPSAVTSALENAEVF